MTHQNTIDCVAWATEISRMILEAGNLSSEFLCSWVLVRSLFFFADGHLLALPLHGREKERAFMPLLIRTLILLDQGSTLVASFNLNCFYNGHHVFKYSHTGKLGL